MAIRDRGRRFRKVGAIALVMIVLSLLTLALPVRTWRTRQLPATPLEIVDRGPAGSNAAADLDRYGCAVRSPS